MKGGGLDNIYGGCINGPKISLVYLLQFSVPHFFPHLYNFSLHRYKLYYFRMYNVKYNWLYSELYTYNTKQNMYFELHNSIYIFAFWLMHPNIKSYILNYIF